MVDKYPVYGPSGRKYYVSIVEERRLGGYSVFVYEKKRRLFGLIKFRNLYVSYCDISDFGHDFIDMAKSAVLSYEERLSDEAEEERLIEEHVKKFEEWDGKVGDNFDEN